MPTRIAKIAAAFLVGLGLAWAGIAPSVPVSVAGAQVAMACCAGGCGKCGSVACCTGPENRAPARPASLPWTQANHWQALAPVLCLLPTPRQIAFDLSLSAASSASQDGSVPIFQRNCSFLI